ncbi:hypothetical protein HDR58_04255, partial [bacterium]|nr:hypothetical protein [bacterium]
MKVLSNINIPYLSNYSFKNKIEGIAALNTSNESENNYSTPISFQGGYNLKVKSLNIDLEKNKLLKSISTLLAQDVPALDVEDMVITLFRRALSTTIRKYQLQSEIYQKAETIANDRFLNKQQKLNLLNSLQKELSAIKNMKPFSPKKSSASKDESIDYPLLSKFKSAILEDNFDLAKIYRIHYSELNNISSVEELKTLFPHIKFPEKAEKVICRKIEKSLTRDFYQGLDDLAEKKSPEILFEYSDSKVRQIFKFLADKYKLNPESLYQRLADTMHTTILDRYKSIILDGGYSSVSEFKKNPFQDITNKDIDLLCLDYDDFVLSVIRRQYLGGEKLNEIVYKNEYVSIPVASLKESEYKFEKLSEKVKKIISSGLSIRKAQRDYDNFSIAKLKSCLDNYSNNPEVGGDEILLEKMIEFGSCDFSKEDIGPLIRFLRELDFIRDGEKTCKEVVKTIKKENIRPHGTFQRTEIERKEALAKLKVQQQQAFQLNELRRNFDNVINLLYLNGLNDLALSCAKYRPKYLQTKDVFEANSVISMINAHVDSLNNSIDKSNLQTVFMRWDTFNLYKKQPDNPIYKNAVMAASRIDGSIDVD